jgi:hypothetical protein
MGSFHLAAGPKKSWLFITNPKDINCQSNPKPDAILQILDLAVQKLCAPNKTTSSATVCCSLFAFELAAKLPKIIAGPDINHVFGPKMPLNLLKLFSSHSGGHGCLKIRNYPEKKKQWHITPSHPTIQLYPHHMDGYGWFHRPFFSANSLSDHSITLVLLFGSNHI